MQGQSMDALVLVGPNEFEIQTADVPSPAPGEVLCKVHSVAICGTDKEIISGNFLKRGWPGAYPYTPGHEWSGEVVSLGQGADLLGFEVGDRVAGADHTPACRAPRQRDQACRHEHRPHGRSTLHLASLWLRGPCAHFFSVIVLRTGGIVFRYCAIAVRSARLRSL